MNIPGGNYEIVAIGNIRLREIQNSSGLKIPAQKHDVIERIWSRTLEENGGCLFNGTLLNFAKLDKKSEAAEITGYFIEYKQFFAQRKLPDLNLGIKPIGVSGILVLMEAGSEYVVFAKRSNHVTEYPGFFELVPSGSIDKEDADSSGDIDYQSKLLSEFSEETGLSKDYVKGISGFALVRDVDHNVYDVCCKISLEEKKELTRAQFSVSKEHQVFTFVAMDDLDSFMKEKIDSIVPASVGLIEAYKQSL